MDSPNQLLVGGQITDALSLAIQVLQMQIGVLERAKATLDGGSSSGDDEPEKQRRGRSPKGETKRRGPARKVDDQAILDYFKQQPRSIKSMATDLNVTLTYAHKRVKGLMKSLKKVKEGTSVLYMFKPRRGAKEKATGKGSKSASAAN